MYRHALCFLVRFLPCIVCIGANDLALAQNELEILADAPIRLDGVPVDDVDLALDEATDTIAVLTESADRTTSFLHRLSPTTQAEKALLQGYLRNGLDPLVSDEGYIAALTVTGRQSGLLHLWQSSDAQPTAKTLPGRPVSDVDILELADRWLAVAVQTRKAILLQQDSNSASGASTSLKGFLQSGVDMVRADAGNTILIPTIDPLLSGSYIEAVEQKTGTTVLSIDLTGLLVSDQDLVFSRNREHAVIATASFDDKTGFLSRLDLANGIATIACLPGVPIPGDDPVVAEELDLAVIPISNRYGSYDHLAIVDLVSMDVTTIDLPGRARPDSDVVLADDERYAVIAVGAEIVRVDLTNKTTETFTLPGAVPESVDYSMAPDDENLLLIVHDGAAASALVTFHVPSAALEQTAIGGSLRSGVDLEILNSDGRLRLVTAANNGFETLIHAWQVRHASAQQVFVASRLPASNATRVTSWKNGTRVDLDVEGYLVAAVDFQSAGPDHPDEDYIAAASVCSAPTEPSTSTPGDKQKEGGPDEPPLIFIPGSGPGELDDDGTAHKIGQDFDLTPDDEGAASGYDDVVFTGLRNAQGTLSRDTLLADPYRKTVRRGPPMTAPRRSHFSKTLADGNVLVGGGRSDAGQSLKSTELFDGSSFRPLADMSRGRIGAAAVNLKQCGNVLVTGGKENPQGGPGADGEIFILIGGNWQPTGPLAIARSYHQMVVAPDSAVWVFGGEDQNGPVAAVERFDPVTGAATVVGQLSEARSHFAAVPFGDGRVALIGGKGVEQFGIPGYPVATVELWDMVGGEGYVAAELPIGLSQPVAYALDERTLVVAGGQTVEGPSPSSYTVDLEYQSTTVSSIRGAPGATFSSTTRRKPADDEDPTLPPEPPRERDPTTTAGGSVPPPIPEPDDDEDPNYPSGGPNDAPDPVHLNSGEFYTAETDYLLAGRNGFDLSFVRTYRSRMKYLGVLGHGWDHNFNERLLAQGNGDYELHTGSGSVAVYSQDPATGRYVSPPGQFDRLTVDANGKGTIRDRNGFKSFFGDDGRLLRKTNRFGDQLVLDYNADGRLAAVRGPYGRALTFHYDDRDLLIRIEDFAGRTVVYRYDEAEQLIAVTTHAVVGTPHGNDFPRGKTTRYTYACSTDDELKHNLLTVTRPNEVANGGPPQLINVYGEDKGRYDFDKIVRQVYGGTNHTGIEAGGTIAYEYENLNPGSDPTDRNLARNRTTIEDRNGNVSVYEHSISGAEIKVVYRAGNHRPIDDSANPAPGTDPSEVVVHNEYSDTGMLLRSIRSMGNVVEREYDASNPDPLQRGNVLRTRFIPDARGGKEIVSELGYEPIYNQVRTVVSPLGNDPTFQPRVGAWSRDRFTTVVTFDYQENQDLSALADETGLSEAEVADLLQAAGVAIGLGDINGDGNTDQHMGGMIRQREPSAILPAWSTQRAIEGGDRQPRVTTYVQNAFGQLVRETDAVGNVKIQKYYPESDPDGDGQDILPGTSATGGYLRTIVRDAATSPGRQSPIPPRQLVKAFKYDRFGNRTHSTDARGFTSVSIFNERNQVVRTISPDPESYEIDYYFDHNDNLIRVDVENKRQDLSGNSRRVAENPYFTTRFEFDILDQTVATEQETTRPYVPGEPAPPETSRRISYRYDGNGNQTDIILADGKVTRTEFDAFDRIFRKRHAFGTPDEAVETFHYDKNGNLILHIDAVDHGRPDPFDGDPTFHFYDGNDYKIASVDALGNVKSLEYDIEGRILTRRLYDGQDGRNPDRKHVGHNGRLLSEDRQYYDEAGNIFESEESLFDPLQPTSIRQVVKRKEYDRLGKIVRRIDADGESIAYTYDGADAIVRQIDDLGNTKTFELDANHNIVKVTTVDIPDGGGTPIERSTHTVVDSHNRPVRQTNHVGDTTYMGYDSRGNQIWHADALGVEIPDPLGLVPTPINKPGNVQRSYFDALSRLSVVASELRRDGVGFGAPIAPPGNPDGRIVTRRRFDDRDQLVELIDDEDGAGNAGITRFVHDVHGNVIREIRPDNTSITTSYDADGLVSTARDSRGNVFRYDYDDLGRTLEVDVVRAPGVGGTTRQTFSYDGRSLLLTSSDNNDPADPNDDMRIEYARDSLGRLTRQTLNGIALNAAYDDEGLLTEFVHSDGTRVVYERDAIDRLRNVDIADGAGSPRRLASYAYAERGKVRQIDYGRGTQLVYDYDDNGRQRKLVVRNALTSAIHFDVDYVYDPLSRRRASIYRHEGGRGDVYAYDSVGRLSRVAYGVPDPMAELQASGTGGTPERDVSYELDGAGNPFSTTETLAATGPVATAFQTNALNQITGVGGSTFTYDADGFPRQGNRHRYSFDAFGRLLAVSSGQTGQIIVTYRYDTEHRRRSVRYKNPQDGILNLALLYWSNSVIEEWNVDSTPVLRARKIGSWYVDARDLRDSDNDGNSDEFIESFVSRDLILNAVVATNDAGDLLERYDYDVWGVADTRSQTGVTRPSSAINVTDLFTGYRYEPATGLYDARSREYDPRLGRFVQPDPLGLAGGQNLYQYASGDPVNNIDRQGTSSSSAGGQGGYAGPRNPTELRQMIDALTQIAGHTYRKLEEAYPGGRWQGIREEKQSDVTKKLNKAIQSLTQMYNDYAHAHNARTRTRSTVRLDWNWERMSGELSEYWSDAVQPVWTAGMTALSFMPVASDVMDFIGVATGYDIATLSELSTAERALMVAGMVAGSGTAAVQAYRATKKAAKAADSSRDALRATDNAAGCPGGTCTPGSRGPGCFVAGTPVFVQKKSSEDGADADPLQETAMLPIEEIAEGDLVLARSDKNGVQTWKPVVRTVVREVDRILRVSLRDEHGRSEVFEVTDEHPFWSTHGGWTKASRLLPGDRVSMADGSWARIDTVVSVRGPHTVYNFEVADFHSYFVGDNGAWVHNTDECFTDGAPISQGEELVDQADIDKVDELITEYNDNRIGDVTQEHHLVPHEHSTHNHQDHELVRLAERDIKTDPRNIVSMKGHRSNHWDPYHEGVKKHLNAGLDSLGTNPSQAAADAALGQVYKDIARDISNGTLPPYENRTVTILRRHWD